MKWFQSGAQDASGQVFADYDQQCAAVRDGSVISPLAGFSVLHVSGEDAQAFLLGQLSSDVRELNGGQGQYSSYSNAKGRMLASMLLWQFKGEYYLILSADIAPAICKRLSMFIMRSRVKMVLRPDIALLGLKGEQGEAWLWLKSIVAPAATLGLAGVSGCMCLRLPSGGVLLALDGVETGQWVGALPADVLPVCQEAWSLLDIEAGIPWIGLSSQEQFVAQMANMDLIGAVSFTKGCYPGQEIIARTRYLGKIKRRMALVRLPSPANNGDVLYSPSMGDQSIGMLVNVARAAAGQYLALAVVQTACWADGIFLDKDNNQALEQLALPYSVVDE
jgi:folate-binding protein YgfZ